MSWNSISCHKMYWNIFKREKKSQQLIIECMSKIAHKEMFPLFSTALSRKFGGK